jgi:aspartyl protease family protein
MKKIWIVFISISILSSCMSRSAQKMDILNPISLPQSERSSSKITIEMVKKDGVYYIPVDINGVGMSFIFDTGASNISISEVEANYLVKQGTLTQEDIIGNAKFSDANGDISDGTIIRLKTVKIGQKELKNVEASIVHSQKAPLLLGQSAFERFGKVSVDYKKQTISFE